MTHETHVQTRKNLIIKCMYRGHHVNKFSCSSAAYLMSYYHFCNTLFLFSVSIVCQKYIGTSIKVDCATRSLYASSGPKAEGVPTNNQRVHFIVLFHSKHRLLPRLIHFKIELIERKKKINVLSGYCTLVGDPYPKKYCWRCQNNVRKTETKRNCVINQQGCDFNQF